MFYLLANSGSSQGENEVKNDVAALPRMSYEILTIFKFIDLVSIYDWAEDTKGVGFRKEERRYADTQRKRQTAEDRERDPEKNIRRQDSGFVFFSYFYFRLIVMNSFGIIFDVIKFSMSS